MQRWFTSFKSNTSLHDKVMVFTNTTRNQAWDLCMQHYPLAIHKLYSEQEFAQVLPNHFNNHNNWVQFGSECVVYEEDEYGSRLPVIVTVYEGEKHQVSLKPITDWFKTAKPEPTNQNIVQQTAYHFEEIAEMCTAIGNTMLAEQILAYKQALLELTPEQCDEWVKALDKVALLDSLADQTVTATGVAYMAKMDFDGALTEVNASNFSKFEDGKPVINEQGKIIKGKNYFKPSLEKYLPK